MHRPITTALCIRSWKHRIIPFFLQNGVWLKSNSLHLILTKPNFMPPPRRLQVAAIHIIIWVLYISNAIFAYAYEGEDVRGIVYETTVNFLISASVFYINAYVLLPRFIGGKRYALYTLFIVLLWTYNLGIRLFFGYIVDPALWNRPSSLIYYSTPNLIIKFNWYFFQFCLYSTGYWFFTKHIKRQQEARDKEKTILEHAMLKAQVNPHFLYNTLTHFQAETKAALPQVSAGIVALNDLLRYSLDAPEQDGMIFIEDEVHNIEQLLYVYEQQYGNNIHISLEKNFPLGSYRLPPKILFTLVENTLKYGDLHDPGNPVKIKIAIHDDTLHFVTSNNKRTGEQYPSNGVGLKYLRSNLDACYKNKHTLQINDALDSYILDLKLLSPAAAL